VALPSLLDLRYHANPDLPSSKSLNVILFYPGAVTKGEESSRKRVLPPARRQTSKASPVDYLEDELGIERWVPGRYDYVIPTPHTDSGSLPESQWRGRRRPLLDHLTRPLVIPIGRTSFRDQALRQAPGQRRPAVGLHHQSVTANWPFYRELGNQSVLLEIPGYPSSVGEEQNSPVSPPAPGRATMAAWNYFMSEETPENEAFIQEPGTPSPRTPTALPIWTDGKRLHRLSTCG